MPLRGAPRAQLREWPPLYGSSRRRRRSTPRTCGRPRDRAGPSKSKFYGSRTGRATLLTLPHARNDGVHTGRGCTVGVRRRRCPRPVRYAASAGVRAGRPARGYTVCEKCLGVREEARYELLIVTHVEHPAGERKGEKGKDRETDDGQHQKLRVQVS